MQRRRRLSLVRRSADLKALQTKEQAFLCLVSGDFASTSSNTSPLKGKGAIGVVDVQMFLASSSLTLNDYRYAVSDSLRLREYRPQLTGAELPIGYINCI